MSRQDLEAQFLAHLPAAERILSALARRHALSRDAAEEFSAWAKLRLIENDYAILAKFRGESSLATYLTVLSAETNVLAQRRLGVDIRARTLDTQMLLVRALGGGYVAPPAVS